MRGIFISLEGIDGCGKSTLKEHLLDYLQNDYNLISIREPGGTIISEKIREIILDPVNLSILPQTEAFLYASARAQLVNEVIIPELAKGSLIIADRFTDSTLAYQGYGRGLDIKFLEDLNFLCTNGIKADLTLLLDIDPEEALKRKEEEPDRLEKEGLIFQEKVREGYLQIAKKEPERVKLINSDQNIEKIKQIAIDYIEKLLVNSFST